MLSSQILSHLLLKFHVIYLEIKILNREMYPSSSVHLLLVIQYLFSGYVCLFCTQLRIIRTLRDGFIVITSIKFMTFQGDIASI